MKIAAAALALLLMSACAPSVPMPENVAANAMTDDDVTEVLDETVSETNATAAENVAVDPE